MTADCELAAPESRLEQLRRQAARDGVPLHATFALTHRCNLQCVHCYALPQSDPARTELSTEAWIALASEAAEAGTLSVLLTGGEPLSRPDFIEIYKAVRRMGIYVTVFTNATLINERVIEAFLAAPPRLIEISVYGTTPESYAQITGRPEAYEAAMRGIDLLRKAGLPVRLKTVLMKANQHEFAALCKLGQTVDPRFRYDSNVMPRFDGDKIAASLRVPVAEVVTLEASIPELSSRWIALKEAAQKPQQASVDGEMPLYTCRAGVVSFYVTPYGRVQACVLTTRQGVPYKPGGLVKAWRETRDAVRSMRAPRDYACTRCPDRMFCGACPPIAELECGDPAGFSPYACALARERRRCLTDKTAKAMDETPYV